MAPFGRKVLSPSFCSRMGFVVNFNQIFRVQMGVNLRRDEAFVSQKFLHTANVRSVVQKMRRKTVP